MSSHREAGTQFLRLVGILDELREKCPWDKQQTIHSLRSLTIEETYELAESILLEDTEGIKEEIGDLMLHLLFYAKIAQENNWFSLTDTLAASCEKLIARHPHVYGDMRLESEEEVKRNWEKLKMASGKRSLLQGVPRGLPAMIKALRLQEKTKQVGFEWQDLAQVKAKVIEEWKELDHAIEKDNAAEIMEEFGDLLFALINYARFLKVDPEMALDRVNQKFKNRFEYIEKHAGKPLEEMSLAELDALWDQAKRQNSQIDPPQ